MESASVVSKSFFSQTTKSVSNKAAYQLIQPGFVVYLITAVRSGFFGEIGEREIIPQGNCKSGEFESCLFPLRDNWKKNHGSNVLSRSKSNSNGVHSEQRPMFYQSLQQNQPTDHPTDKQTRQQTNHPTNQPSKRPSNQQTNPTTNQPSNQPTNHPTNHPTDKQTRQQSKPPTKPDNKQTNKKWK